MDPILLEVLRNKFDAIADEMEITLLKSAYSSIVKEGLDASAAIFDANGDTIAQATAIPIHLGALIFGVKRMLRTFPAAQMAEGDLYLLNDPYDGGTHLPDLILVVPIFAGGRPVALACTMCHHQEIGGKTPGSVPTDATEIYQEGLVIPPCRLARQGQMDQTLLEIIRRNVRIPDIIIGDLMAQVAAGRLAGTRMLELFTRYGVGEVLKAVEELYARSEALTRRHIEALPDGTYRFVDYMDNDGIDLDRRVRIEVAVTVRGSSLTFDFTGTCPQVRGPFNCVPSSTMSAVYYAVRAMTDPDIPNNAGCFRPVEAILPPGTLVNPNPPAPVSCRTATVKRLADTILGALVKVLPSRIPAAGSGTLLVMALGGRDPRTGRAFVASELGAGGMGARPEKDGIDGIETDVSNCMNIPVEAVEMEFPIRIARCRLWQDSAGAGRWRGGLGLEKIFEATRAELTVSHRGERFYTAPWGLFGGLPARNGDAWVLRQGGSHEAVPSKQVLTLKPGEQLHVFLAGGAGHGDPLERDAERVRADVLDRRVSLRAAADDHGVVLEPESLAVDVLRTESLRSQKRAARGPITWAYDRGEGLGREA